MTESQPRNDFASFPAPAEGILVALFITVRKVARSRDFYSRVLGGTVILDENPCTVRLSNSWIIMNPGGRREAGEIVARLRFCHGCSSPAALADSGLPERRS